MLNCTQEDPNGTSPHSYVDSLTGVGLRGCSRRESPSIRATVTAPRTINTSTVANSVSIPSRSALAVLMRREPPHAGRGATMVSSIIFYFGENLLYTIDTIRYSGISPSQPKNRWRPTDGKGGGSPGPVCFHI